MNRISLFAAMFVVTAGLVFSTSNSRAASAVTAVALPDNVLAYRDSVAADLAAVASARAKLVADIASGNAGALQAAVAAYEAARVKLNADLQTLRTGAESILRQDEANVDDDRILLEIYVLTNNSTYTTAQAQFNADLAQADANREAIFGNLCPESVVCTELPGAGAGPFRGFGPGAARRGR